MSIRFVDLLLFVAQSTGIHGRHFHCIDDEATLQVHLALTQHHVCTAVGCHRLTVPVLQACDCGRKLVTCMLHLLTGDAA